MKNTLLLAAILLATTLAQAQRNGLILDDDAYEETPLIEKDTITREKLPKKVDLRKYCPTAGDQGNLPSCPAWALANVMTIHKAMREESSGQQQIDELQYSVAYIYNQIKHKGECDLGASINKGLNLLKEKGNCLASEMPYSEDCDPTPNRKHHQKAYAHRIRNYYKIFGSEDTEDTKVDNILDQLVAGRPVIIALDVPYDFRLNIPAPYTDWQALDPHAMVVVGYTTLGRTFTILNSYGPDWGQDGFYQMDWDTLGEWVRYGFVIAP